MIDQELVTRKMVLVAEDLRRLEALAAKDRDVPAYLAALRLFLDTAAR